MIPQYPHFKPLERGDKEGVENFTKQHAPYSDFNFVSLWSWNIHHNTLISQLHNNLVVRFADYITAEPFYMFLGTNKVDATANDLLERSKHEGLELKLKLIPEISAKKLDEKNFAIAEDTNHTDYVIAVDKLSTYEGAELAGKRRAVSQFRRRTTEFEFSVLNLDDPKIDAAVRALFSRWLAGKNLEAVAEEEHEYKALSRCLESHLNGQLIGTGVYVKGTLVAFWLLEDLGAGYAISHFEKADTAIHAGVFPFLKLKTGEVLRDRGITFVNLEQDLGIAGLRVSKMSYFPQLFLRKYSVTGA